MNPTEQFKLPKGLLNAVCWVESSHRPQVIHKDDGKGHSVGLCQIKIGTARMLGFSGTQEDLLDPVVNAYYSGKYLSKQIKRYNGNLTKAIAAYNAGRFNADENGLPLNKKYVKKVMKAWAEKR